MDSNWLIWGGLVALVAAPLAWACTWKKSKDRPPPSWWDVIPHNSEAPPPETIEGELGEDRIFQTRSRG